MSQTAVPKPIETQAFHAVPPAPRHAITLYIPGWENVLKFLEFKPEFFAQFKGTYPRIFLHEDVKKFMSVLVEKAGKSGQNCFPFPSADIVQQCFDLITMPNRPDGLDTVPAEEISTHAFEFGPVRVFAIFFPAQMTPLVHKFWEVAGMTISSRRAEEALKHVDSCIEIPMSKSPTESDKALQSKINHRIAGLLERARIDRTWSNDFERSPIQPDRDVFLLPTGMAAIYFVHTCLLKWKSPASKTVLLGVPFHSTPYVFKTYGGGVEWLGLGTEYDDVEKFVKQEAATGHPVTAVWTEFPSNPLVVSSDLNRLRQLADKYNFALVVDDTLSGFCSVDVLPVADVVVTSLTKSFSGYADVMAGSAVLNPSSPLANTLRSHFSKAYHNYVYDEDMRILLKNSDDYLERSKIYNDNANGLVKYLHGLTKDPTSSVSRVFYPSVAPTASNYQAFMRPKTEDFTPGYGCLFNVEFDSMDAMIAFYDNLRVHHGPHLGAHRTLAIPYTKLLFHKMAEEVKKWDLYPSQVRVSVGLEPFEELEAIFKYAVQKADDVKRKLSANGTNGDVNDQS